jgi:hypothetical protein
MLLAEFAGEPIFKVIAVCSSVILLHDTTVVDSFICWGRRIACAESITLDEDVIRILLILHGGEKAQLWATKYSSRDSGGKVGKGWVIRNMEMGWSSVSPHANAAKYGDKTDPQRQRIRQMAAFSQNMIFPFLLFDELYDEFSNYEDLGPVRFRLFDFFTSLI